MVFSTFVAEIHLISSISSCFLFSANDYNTHTCERIWSSDSGAQMSTYFQTETVSYALPPAWWWTSMMNIISLNCITCQQVISCPGSSLNSFPGAASFLAVKPALSHSSLSSRGTRRNYCLATLRYVLQRQYCIPLLTTRWASRIEPTASSAN